MFIILGAAGQIGSMLADQLLKKGQAVRAVVRNKDKGNALQAMGAEIAVADFMNEEELKQAFCGGTTAFLLTPENPECKDFIGETKTILSHYKEAVKHAGIRRIVGLSSMGAQHEKDTGNLQASYLLEHSFEEFGGEKIFVRPSYYFSNWLGFIDLIREYGILPTFFPPEMKIPMIAPPDVAEFLSGVMMGDSIQKKVREITGPFAYSSLEIAEIFGEVLQKNVTLQQILPENWEKTLLASGFSEDGARNIMLMTQAVIDGKTKSETVPFAYFSTQFKEYLLRKMV